MIVTEYKKKQYIYTKQNLISFDLPIVNVALCYTETIALHRVGFLFCLGHV